MLAAMPTGPSPANRAAIASLIAGAFVAFNVGFYFMSASYTDAQRAMVGATSVPVYSPEQLMHLRVSFATFSAVVAGGFAAAAFFPALIGHAIPALLGVVHLVAAGYAVVRGAPPVVGMVLLVTGLLMPVLAWKSARRSRAAWAFLVALCGVFAVVELFASPKIRVALDIGQWTTLILPGLNAVAVQALVSLRANYVER
jgi:hypothetical protein